MSGNFKVNKTKRFEEMGKSFLCGLGINCRINNNINVTSTDYIAEFNGKEYFIDFQFSQNFSKYKDIRVDIISAYNISNSKNNRFNLQNIIHDNYEHFQKNGLKELNKYIKIKKLGKVINEDISHLFYFVYDNFAKVNITPDHIYIVRRTDMLKYIEDNIVDIIKEKCLKLNDKSSLGDNFGSAFVALNADSLKSKGVGLWLDMNVKEIKNYLNEKNLIDRDMI